MLAVVLGLLVAAGFGAGDFLGGRASQSASTPGVLLMSQLTAATGAVLVTFAFSADVTTRDIVLGASAGTLDVIGLGLLYQGLSMGRMGVVAPTTAVVGSVFPITWGLLQGERPSALALVGVVGAVVAGALIGTSTEHARGPNDRVAMLCAAGAGLGFGSSFILFAKTSTTSGNVPVLAARISAVVVVSVAVALMATRRKITFPTGTQRIVALGAGALDVTATTLLLVAVREGLIVVVAPIAALAPAMTVVLAWSILKEHVGRTQLGGLAIALVSLALIATG